MNKQKLQQLNEFLNKAVGMNFEELKSYMTNPLVTNQAKAIKMSELSLTPNVFFTDVLDTINNDGIGGFEIFIKNSYSYGKGYRQVGRGIKNSRAYDETAFTPKPINARDYENFSQAFIQTVYPTTYYQAEISKYFKSADDFMAFLSLIRNENDESYKAEMLDMFLYIFGQDKSKLNLPESTNPDVITELDKVKNAIRCTKAIDGNNWKDIFKNIYNVAIDMGTRVKTGYNIGYAFGESTEGKRNCSKMGSDLVFIVSSLDLNDKSAEVSQVFHQQFYQGENKFLKVIQAEIPRGTAYIIDKEALRFNERLSQVESQYWAPNMAFSLDLNKWFSIGIVPWTNGIKLTFTVPTDAMTDVRDERPLINNTETVDNTPAENVEENTPAEAD